MPQQSVGYGPTLLAGRSHYIGGSGSPSISDVPQFGRVRYRDLYPGIDLEFYGDRGTLEYDFIVAAGVQPDVIGLRFQGAERVLLNDAGDLVLNVAGSELVQRAPEIYQQIDGVRRPVSGAYTLRPDGTVGFRIGPYDTRRPLVIDPFFAFATHLGGSGFDEARAIAVDRSGAVYLAGVAINETFADPKVDFPITEGAYKDEEDRRSERKSFKTVVTKLRPDGRSIVYSTYFPVLITNIVPSNIFGAVILAGPACARDIGEGARLLGGGDCGVYVAQLNSTGSALNFASVIGGPDSITDLAERLGRVYLTGVISSDDLPTTPGVIQPARRVADDFQTAQRNPTDAFVAKLSPGGAAIEFATYLGGTGTDSGMGIAIDRDQNVYVALRTSSQDLPTTPGSFQPPPGGNSQDFDAFVAKLNPTATRLEYATYVGGSRREFLGDEFGGHGSLAVDRNRRVYLAGATESDDFPTRNAFQRLRRGEGNRADAFLVRLTSAGDELEYSTHLGGTGTEDLVQVGVDSDGNAVLFGRTNSSDFPLKESLQSELRGADDVFVAKLSRGQGTLVYSTYLGGPGQEKPAGISVEGVGIVYVAGTTDGGVPAVNALQPNPTGGKDWFVIKLSDRAPEQTAPALVVNTTNDNDDGTCGERHCSLREAIGAANDRDGTDTISFNIGSGFFVRGRALIQPRSPLPTITEPVIIDATSQVFFNRNPAVELSGSLAGDAASGLHITGGGSTVRGLAITGFGRHGMWIESGGENRIEANHIGVSVGGRDAEPNGNGVYIANSARNVIGGAGQPFRNLIHAVAGSAVIIEGAQATGNRVEGNFIGITIDGSTLLGPSQPARGIYISGAPANIIGGSTEASRNLIAGYVTNIEIAGEAAVGNRVTGNYLGVWITGLRPFSSRVRFPGLRDTQVAVRITDGSQNVVGGASAGERNVIAGYTSVGVVIKGQAAVGNRVLGNYIGVDAAGGCGEAAGSGGCGLGGVAGVLIDGASSNTVGGVEAGARNVIAANGDGVRIKGQAARLNLVRGNYIGVNAAGDTPLPNRTGVRIEGAPSFGIGGTEGVDLSGRRCTGACNLIAGNTDGGVVVVGDGAVDGAVQGNFIGLKDPAVAARALGNGAAGVSVADGAGGIFIGGAARGAGNVIAYNGGSGVAISSGGGSRILSNRIFANDGLGIALAADTVLPNDAQDGDTGANGQQNYPVLGDVQATGTQVAIAWSLDSLPDTTFVLEFFSNDECDPSGHGEGQRLIAQAVVLTDPTGRATFERTFETGITGRFVTATATKDRTKDTSEFSACRVAEGTILSATPATDFAGLRVVDSRHDPTLGHNIANVEVTRAGQQNQIARFDAEVESANFLDYYDRTGGLDRWGLGTSEIFEESRGTLTQYFQRGVVDWKPAPGGGPASLQRRLGWDFIGGGLGGSDDQGVEPGLLNLNPGDELGPWGHKISNLAVDGTEIGFKEFFDRLGGKDSFGFPKTDARPDTHADAALHRPGRTKDDRIRQYLQAAVLEFHPESSQPVKIGLIGDTLRDLKYPNNAWEELLAFQRAEPLTVGADLPRG